MIFAARARWVARARATRDACVLRAFACRTGAVSGLGAVFVVFAASRARGRSTAGATRGFAVPAALVGFGVRAGAAGAAEVAGVVGVVCVATVPVVASLASCPCVERTSVAPVDLVV